MNVVGFVGSPRKGGTTDSLVDVISESIPKNFPPKADIDPMDATTTIRASVPKIIRFIGVTKHHIIRTYLKARRR